MQIKALKSASSSKKAKKITEKLNAQHAKQIIRNREILSTIIHEIETCGRLNIPLRGHRDSGPINVCVDREHIDYMQGNLRCLLQKAAIRDNILREHLLNGPKNASYLSPETQNNLITCIGNVLLRHISNEIHAAKYYAVTADETTDVHKDHQMTITFRYVNDEHEICESFAGFIEVEETTGKALSYKILQFIENIGLEKRNLEAQCYDGACAMSGIYSGVQALIRADCPSAVYVHCSAHCLNLVLSKSREIPEIKSAMAIIQNACLYFKNSTQRIHNL